MNSTLEEIFTVADEIDEKLYGPKEKIRLLTHLVEEAKELLEAATIAEAHPSPSNKLDELKEFGDVLFCLVSCQRQYDWDMREALALTITKLQERLKYGVE